MSRHGGLAAAAAVCATGLSARPCLAHGTAERYDLPIPLYYYVAGAGLVVTLSFIVTGLFVLAPRSRPMASQRVLGIAMPGERIAYRVLQIIGLAALAAVVTTGLFGEQHAARNLAPNLVWVLWWVGLSLFVALVANIWPALNPWRTLGLLGERIWPLRADRGRPHPYPARLAEWPAVAALAMFEWVELVSPFASSPRVLALMALAHIAGTMAAMRCYGVETWLARGEAFTLAFSLLGRFAPFALSGTAGDRRLIIRAPGAGLAGEGAASNAVVAFLLLLLTVALFDGLLGTAFWRFFERWFPGDRSGYLAASVGLLTLWLVFFAAYLGACALMAAIMDPTGGTSAMVLARRYALTLVPIAVGYNVAHNFAYLLIQGQSLWALISDPFGIGWNLFGTAGAEPDPGIIGARTTWRVALGAIVTGHVIAVVLAHVIAIRSAPSRRAALMGMIPMTLVMVLYTAVSLSIIADPLVRYRTPDPGYTQRLEPVPLHS